MNNVASTAFSLLKRAVGVGVATTLIGLILPGLVAYESGMFDAESMARRVIPTLPAEIRDQLERYRASRLAAEHRLSEIDALFISSSQITPDQIVMLNAQRAVANQVLATNPPASFLAFYLSSGMLLWVLTLTPLAWLALLFFPGSRPFESLKIGRVLTAGFLIYVSYQWTVWMRYFVLKNNGRKVIGFANYDISHAGFWIQEAQTVLFFALLSGVCFQWLEFAGKMPRVTQDHTGTLKNVTELLSKTFSRWQLTSLLLTLSFFPFTGFYWEQVVHIKDMRFLPAAIILHTIWAASWAAISAPLYVAWSNWRAYKIALLQHAIAESDGDGIIKVLEAAEPIGDWAKALSAALTALSFIGPFLKVVFN